MSGVSNINEFPKEIRDETFIRVPLRNLFGLWRVCRLWNTEISDGFFRKRCQMNFEGIDTIPRFYSLLTETAQTPWKLLCYALSGIKVNDQLKPLAEQCAIASLPNVRPYLQRRLAQFQEQRDQAIERFKAKHPGEEPILDLKVLHDSFGKLQEEFMCLNLDLRDIGGGRLMSPFPKMIHDILPALRQEFPETNLEPIFESPTEENFDLRLRILDAALRLQRGINADARLIRFIELGSQLFKAMAKPQQSRELLELSPRIDFFNSLMQQEVQEQTVLFEKVLKRSYFRILSLLPHLRNWMPHLEKIKTIEPSSFFPLSVPTGASAKILLGFIHSLPNPLQARIWQQFNSKYEIGEKELQSNPDQQHLVRLHDLIKTDFEVLSLHLFSEDSENHEFFTMDVWDNFKPPKMDPNFFDVDLPATVEPAGVDPVDQ